MYGLFGRFDGWCLLLSRTFKSAKVKTPTEHSVVVVFFKMKLIFKHKLSSKSLHPFPTFKKHP